MTFSFKPLIFATLALVSFTFAATAQKETSIAEIQGDKARSAMENQQVTTRGIVTARTKNGIFIQTPDDKADKNPATSEGVFVYIGKDGSFDGAVGDMVEVAATVQEFMPRSEKYGFTITELGKATIKKISTKNALPTPITLTPNDLVPNKLDMMERYEGMRVKVDTLVVVGATGGRIDDKTGVATSDGAFFGVLPNVARPVREPGVEYFIFRGQNLPQTVPFFDTNPEMLRVDSDAQIDSKPIEVTAGATVKNLVGVIDYSFRRYTLVIDATSSPTVE